MCHLNVPKAVISGGAENSKRGNPNARILGGKSAKMFEQVVRVNRK